MTLVIIALALALALCGCTGADTSAAEQLSAAEASERLQAADEIVLEKAELSMGDRWDVYADGELVATISGEVLYLTDTYTMRATGGEAMLSEEEQFTLTTAKARKFDAEGNVIGHYDQDFTLAFGRVRSLDENDATVAEVKETFAVNLGKGWSAEVRDADGDIAWKASKQQLSVANAKIHLTREAAADDTDATDVAMLVAVFNEVSE